LIKKLDILIIRSFIGPFIVTFFVSLFVLVMQFFWLYMDELIGKGIGLWPILQLLIYMSTTLVPLALPLSILLASIMTFGNMGENFELVAIKSSGISLLRFLMPLFIFIVVVSGGAFLFSNNVIPVANLKALSLLYDIRNAKPTLNIRADQFNNDIPGYSIRVGSKDPDGNTIYDVLIYDHSDMLGNNKVIIAREGQMIATADKQALIFKLRDGWRYQEGYTRGLPDLTQTRMHFAKWDKVFDLSGNKFSRVDQNMFKGNYQMMDLGQLTEQMDTIKKSNGRTATSVNGYVAPYVTFNNNSKESGKLLQDIKSNTRTARKYDSSFLQLIPDSLRTAVLQSALSNTRNIKSLMDVSATTKKNDWENYNKYAIEWHRKFTLSFACILLFLIGAPLGAIIRRGGLGMPLVIAIIFFMAFHILNITGEKLAKTGSATPWLGMWMSTMCLLPLAFWLVKSARNDSQIFTKEWYSRVWRRIKNLLPVKNNDSLA
jgi:lipopolysaccharide export system permease protein